MNQSNTAAQGFGKLIRDNIQKYAMYVVLVIIILIFSIMTHGSFLSARNITNLINQVGYIAVLAIGMTLILIISNIDLSVGYVAGFTGAIAAIMLKNGTNVWLTILACLGIGALIGLYQGTLVAYVGVPAFVTTLAGMFIFRGLLLLTLASTGTIIISNVTFNSLSNGTIPDFFHGNGINILTLAVGAIAIILIIINQLNNRSQRQKYGFKVSSPVTMWAGIIIAAGVVGALTWILAKYRGIPITAAIVAVILLIYNHLLNNTPFGRYIYGIGGNAEATQLSGVNVKKVKLLTFISMSTLASVAGILYTSRLQSAAPQAGVGFEMEAIASSYIGGVAVSGGKGKVTNTLIGAFIMASLTNGMNLLFVDAAFQYIVKGLIFIAAVAFDVINQKRAR